MKRNVKKQASKSVYVTEANGGAALTPIHVRSGLETKQTSRKTMNYHKIVSPDYRKSFIMFIFISKGSVYKILMREAKKN